MTWGPGVTELKAELSNFLGAYHLSVWFDGKITEKKINFKVHWNFGHLSWVVLSFQLYVCSQQILEWNIRGSTEINPTKSRRACSPMPINLPYPR